MNRRRAVLMIAVAALATTSFLAAQDIAKPEAVRAVGGVILKTKTASQNGAAVIQLVNAHLLAPERVRYLREMSGGAHVLQVVPPATKADIPVIIAQLIATGLFEYVEEDRMMSIHRP